MLSILCGELGEDPVDSLASDRSRTSFQEQQCLRAVFLHGMLVLLERRADRQGGCSDLENWSDLFSNEQSEPYHGKENR